MVESSRAKINFIKLTSEELSAKVALLISNHTRVVFWKTLPRCYEGKAVSYELKNKNYITLERTGIPIRILNETVCLNFTLNDIDYYLRGKVEEQEDASSSIKIKLFEHCFRVEKRSSERLLAYPNYEIFAYLKFTKTDMANVILFKKNEQNANDFFLELENRQKNIIDSITKEINLNGEESFLGFRVENLSPNGLSFFANAKEKELVVDKLEKNAFAFVLNFNTQIFKLEEATIVYKMNYINAQFSGVPMYKIGISFKQSPSLKKKIQDVSGIAVDLIDYQKEFEEFILNE